MAMNPAATPPATVSPEQRLQAAILQWGSRAGLYLLALSFLLYLSGLLPARIPPAELPRLWGLPVRNYLHAAGLKPGWGWIGHLGNGDVLPLLAVAVLAALPAAGFLLLAVHYFRRRDHAYAWLCLAELGVLLLAASGLLHPGGGRP
ncbi:MAG: DUF1634 domain-containing protein [Lentisphaeria bacterium]|jgi:hypothetical protein